MCAGWFAGAAQAALMSFNDTNYGVSADGFNITRDTSTGLDWLDVDVSVGISFTDVSAQFGAGQLFEGFRYATKLELSGETAGGQVASLYKSSDLSVLSFGSIGTFGRVRDLLALVGCLRPADHRCNDYGYLTATLLSGDVTFLEAFDSFGTNFAGSGITTGFTPHTPNPTGGVLRAVTPSLPSPSPPRCPCSSRPSPGWA